VTVYALVILFAGYAFLDAIMQALAAPTTLMRLGVGRDLRRSDHHRSPGIGSPSVSEIFDRRDAAQVDASEDTPKRA